MNDRTRNVIVGLTVLVALAILAGLIVLFAGLPSIFQRGQTILVEMDTSAGIREGDAIHMADLRVGRITGIDFTDPSVPLKGVTITARIEKDVYVSPNSVLVVYRNFMGPPNLSLERAESHGIEPVPIAPAAERPPQQLIIRGLIINVGITDAFKPALDSVSKIADQAEVLTRRLIVTADELSRLITSLNNAAQDIETGKGTLGMFVSDPALYNELVSAVRSMNEMADQFAILARKWQTDGIELQMKK